MRRKPYSVILLDEIEKWFDKEREKIVSFVSGEQFSLEKTSTIIVSDKHILPEINSSKCLENQEEEKHQTTANN